MSPETKKELKELAAQLHYNSSEILHLLNSIDRVETKAEQYKDKPFYNTCIAQIVEFQNRIDEQYDEMKKYIEDIGGL